MHIGRAKYRQTERAVTVKDRSASRPPRFAMLDALRLFAALMVVAYHYLARHSNAWGTSPSTVFPTASQIAKYGALGVQLFFIISGFVILMTAWGRTREQYIASRISRLFPGYWICVSLSAILLLVIWPGQKKLSWHDAVVNLTMVQSAFGVTQVDGVYWTLWTELRFYLLVFALMLFGLTYKRLLAFVLLWPVLGALAQVAGAHFVSELLIWQYSPYFAAGTSLFLIFKFGHNLLASMAFLLNVALSIPRTQVTLNDISRYTGLHVSGTVGISIVLLFFVCVAVITLTPLRHIKLRMLTTAGLLTYPLYLLHEWWGWFFISQLRQNLNSYVTLIAAVSLALFMSWLVVRLVEMPIAPRMRSAIENALDNLKKTLSQTDVHNPLPDPMPNRTLHKHGCESVGTPHR